MEENERKWREELYQERLANIPKPFSGYDCHTEIYMTGILGAEAGYSIEEVIRDLYNNKNAKDKGGESYIRRSVKSAFTKIAKNKADGVMRWSPNDGKRVKGKKKRVPLTMTEKIVKAIQRCPEAYRNEFIEIGKSTAEYTKIVQNPDRYYDGPFSETILMLESLYEPDDVLCVDEECENETRTVEKWIELFKSYSHIGLDEEKNLSRFYTHLSINPMGKTIGDDGKNIETVRGNENVSSFKYILCEFDKSGWDMIEYQVPLLLGMSKFFEFEVASLVTSGGKSVHLLIKVDEVANLNDWENKIKQDFYLILKAIGADKSCSNVSRLSRLAGMYRNGEKRQKLLYIKEK